MADGFVPKFLQNVVSPRRRPGRGGVSPTPKPAPLITVATHRPKIELWREVRVALQTATEEQRKVLKDVQVSSVPSNTIDTDEMYRSGRVRISSAAISRGSAGQTRRLLRHGLGHAVIEKMGFPAATDTAFHHRVLLAAGIGSGPTTRKLGRLSDIAREVRRY